MDQFGYSLVLPLFFVAVSFFSALLFDRDVVKASSSILVGYFLAFLFNYLTIGGLEPKFLMFPHGDFIWFLIANWVIVFVVDGVISLVRDSKQSVVANIGVAIVGLFLLFFSWLLSTQPPTTERPGIFCVSNVDTGNRTLASMLEIEQEDQYQFKLPLELMPTVSRREAVYNTNQALPTDLSSWLTVDVTDQSPYLVKINGRFYWHVELKPVNLTGETTVAGQTFNTYMQKGGFVPVFALVDAVDRDKKAELVWYRENEKVTTADQRIFNTKIRFVYGIRPSTGMNATSHLYYNYELPNKVLVDDPGIEYLDDGSVVYTAAVLKPESGYIENLRFQNAVLMNPETGEIKKYDVNDLPESIDRIYSEAHVRKAAEYWGLYSVANWCSPIRNLDKKLRIDRLSYVFSSEGMLYQITFTDFGKGTQIAAIWYVNPRTGKVKMVTPSSAEPLSNIEEVDKVVTTQARAKSTDGYTQTAEAENCVLYDILGEKTVYCQIVAPDTQDASILRSVGFAFFRVRYDTSDAQRVILGRNLEEAYNRLQQQVAQDGNNSPEMSRELMADVYSGTLSRIQVFADRTVFQLSEFPNKLFTVANGDTAAVIIGLSDVGEVVTVSGFSGVNQNSINVGSACNVKVTQCK